MCFQCIIGMIIDTFTVGVVVAKLMRPRLTNFTVHMGSDLFFVWPVTVVHKINEESPFYKMSATDMLQAKFEVVATLDGTVESTGMSTNAKTSYLANEILWAHKFENMVSYSATHECYEANYENFEKLIEIEMPLCSAEDFAAAASDGEDKGEDKDEEKCIGDRRSKTSIEAKKKKSSELYKPQGL
ncbi:hypothetical protein NQ318_012086 [Aromia moschata]|uniref:Inward rectifier potassium channel C-terminal domain-containing protein n=1 Tax=Aromia moschata TaxID=1265417 RepID=A0AAV8XM17_9CUCU|nr:hypothetical protein NQ318_012086 [Aromia moschata]